MVPETVRGGDAEKSTWESPEIKTIPIGETAAGDFATGEAAFGPAFAS